MNWLALFIHVENKQQIMEERERENEEDDVTVWVRVGVSSGDRERDGTDVFRREAQIEWHTGMEGVGVGGGQG